MDKRIYELQDGSSNYQTIFTDLGTVIDSPDISDAKFLKLSSLIKSDRVVSTDSANNYKVISPKAFLESIATESEQGIVKLATESEIINKTGDSAIQSSQIQKIWDSITSTGNFEDSWAIASDGIPKEEFTFTNIIYSGLSNIVHLNGYITMHPNGASNYRNFFKIEFSTIRKPLAGTRSSISCYYINNANEIKNMTGFAENNGNLRLNFYTDGKNFGTLSSNINIYFQVSYITTL